MTRMERQQLRIGLTFVSPWIIGLSVFVLGPVVMAFYYSLTDYTILDPPVYIGAENYTRLVADDVFWQSLRNTVFYALYALPMGTLLSLALALLLNEKIKFRAAFRTIFFLPTLVPLVAVGILWQWILNGEYGVLNYFLRGALAPINAVITEPGAAPALRPPNWLGDPDYILYGLVIANLWGVGHAVVIYLAGLTDVPKALYETADIDGASWWQKTRHVTLPMISPVIYFNLMMGSIFILQEFVTPYVMVGANGGTGRAGLFYTMHMFNEAFRNLNMGYACAMGVALFFIIAGLTSIVHMTSQRHVHYN